MPECLRSQQWWQAKFHKSRHARPTRTWYLLFQWDKTHQKREILAKQLLLQNLVSKKRRCLAGYSRQLHHPSQLPSKLQEPCWLLDLLLQKDQNSLNWNLPSLWKLKGKQQHESILRWIKFVISQCIFSANLDDYVLMCGDFNKNLKDYSKLAEKFGLNPVLSEGTTTHKGGNHLDQIFTNLEHKSYELTDWQDTTDHKLIFTELLINTKRK